MKYPPLKTLIVSLAACLAGPLSAQTTWTGATNAALNNAGNWDNGLPDSAGNPGTIPAEAGAITHSFNLNGYFVTQNGGTLTSSVAFSPYSGSWTLNDGGSLTPGVTTTLQNQDDGHQDFIMNGGTFSASQFNVSSTGTNRSASFTMSGGTATLSSRLDIIEGGTVTINGGSFTALASRMNTGTTLTINGGVNDFGTDMGRSGAIFLNGGTTTVDVLNTYAGFAMTIGGTTSGSYTVGALGGSFMPPNRNFDWLTGSQMSFTVVNDDDWAETEWNANRLKYNGNSKADLGDLSWADAQIDLGDGSYFVYDTGTYTLSLVSGGGGSPEIAVEQPAATDIANGGSQDFGTVSTGSNTSLTFTVRNTGTATLNLTGSPPVAVSGTNADDFTVTADPGASVSSGGGTTTFTVQFAPGDSGVRSALLTIANNDSDENPFTINVSGTGTAETPYETWAGGAAFDADANDDGVKNGLAFLLGADSPTSAVTLPTISESSGNLVMSFSMLNSANRGTATLSVQHSGDLGIGDPWSAGATVPTDGDGVTFTVTPGDPLDTVTAEISVDEAASGKLFGRLKAVAAP